MEQESIVSYIEDAFEGVEIVVGGGNTYFFYDPERNSDPSRRLPFATIVTADNPYDCASNLNRQSVFRLNVGVGKQTYRSLFGDEHPPLAVEGALDDRYDFTALDRLLPHPAYARMSWICVLNPSSATFESLKPMLAEPYKLAAKSSRLATNRKANG